MEPKQLLVKYLNLTFDERVASHEKNMEGFDMTRHKLQSITGRETEWDDYLSSPRNNDIIHTLKTNTYLWRYVDKETGLMDRALVIGDEEFIMWDEPEKPCEHEPDETISYLTNPQKFSCKKCGAIYSKYKELQHEPKVSLNYNEGKIRPSLILRDMQKSFKSLLDVREYGCKKYDRLNWAVSKGTGDADKFLADNLDSIHRHLLEHESGKEVDEESGCLHLAQVAIRCMFAIEYKEAE